MPSCKHRDAALAILAEGYSLWEECALPPLPESERDIAVSAALAVYDGGNAAHFAAACQCFYLFRRLHKMTDAHPVGAVLLGDYFFSLFSKSLIPLDSTELNDEFARFLSRDTALPSGTGMSEYLGFVAGLRVTKPC